MKMKRFGSLALGTCLVCLLAAATPVTAQDSGDTAVKESVLGVNVIVTDLVKLRDSNPIYSAVWRSFIRWFGNSAEGGWLPHPFSDAEEQVTARSYLTMVNFKANHRN